MWIYEKKLEYPVKIKNSNPALAKVIISQLGGPDGELGASMRYLHQRYSMPQREVAGVLTDIGTAKSKRNRFYTPTPIEPMNKQKAAEISSDRRSFIKVQIRFCCSR